MGSTDSTSIGATAEVAPRKRERPQDAGPRPQPPYAVIVFNDDLHTFPYVVETFMKVFGYSEQKSQMLAVDIHNQGRGAVWSGAREVAELKCEQVRSAGPDMYAEKRVDFPLGVMIEPLPG